MWGKAPVFSNSAKEPKSFIFSAVSKAEVGFSLFSSPQIIRNGTESFSKAGLVSAAQKRVFRQAKVACACVPKRAARAYCCTSSAETVSFAKIACSSAALIFHLPVPMRKCSVPAMGESRSESCFVSSLVAKPFPMPSGEMSTMRRISFGYSRESSKPKSAPPFAPQKQTG